MTIQKFSREITVIPVLTGSGAYSSGQAVGVAMELKDAVESTGGLATLISAVVQDSANQKAALTGILFNAQPTTAYADQTTVAPSAADLKLICAIFTVTASYAAFSASAVGYANNIQAKIRQTAPSVQQPNTSSKSLWLLMMTTGTPTYTAANSLTVKLVLEQDG